MNVSVDIAELMDFYLRTKGQAWAAGAKYNPVPSLPDHKEFRHEEGHLLLVDRYFTTPYSSESAGDTVIFVDNHPIWHMTYWGYYQKEAIPFLKQALLYQYNNQRVFLGGRGPKLFQSELYSYHNEADGDFVFCTGREYAVDNITQISLGYHGYRCKYLAS